MMDATKLMEQVFDVAIRHKAEMSDTDDADIHLVKAGAMLAATGMMAQLKLPHEHAERMYMAAVEGMAAEARKIKEQS